MGYTIHYGPAPKISKSRRKLRLGPPVAALLLMISMFTAKYVWPEEVRKLQDAFFPWTQDAVQEAFTVFLEDLSTGDPFHDAAAAFCLEILNDAQQPK